MKKFVKAIKIILLSLLVLALGGYLVLYIVNPELAKQILDTLVEYLNKPLPIIGVSVTVVAVLVWKIFSSTIYGKKKIAEMKAEYEHEKAELKKDYEENKNKCVAVIGYYQKENDVVFESLKKVCEVSANKKVKEIGANLSNEVGAIREELRSKFESISSSDAEVLVESKEQIIESIIESVKKELVEKYGEESKEIVNSISKAEKI